MKAFLTTLALMTLLVAATAHGQTAPELQIVEVASIDEAPPATLVPTGEVRYGFRGDVVLVELTTRKCVHCDEVGAWARDQFAGFGEFGLVLVIVTVDALSARDWGDRYLVETLRANGLAWPDEITDQLKVWRNSGITDQWPVLLVFDRGGELLYAGADEYARSDAKEAISKAVQAPEVYAEAQ